MKVSRGLWLTLLGVFLVVCDQVIKYLIKTTVFEGQIIPVFGEWFSLTFIENKGMAFGISFGENIGKFCLSALRIVLCTALVIWIHKLDKQNKAPVGVLVGLTLVTAGAFGNIIDSLFYGIIWGYAPFMFGKVVDMFRLFPTIFPFVFNFADACVSVGAVYLILFHWKFFSGSSKKDGSQD